MISLPTSPVAPTTAIKNLLYSTYWGGTSYDEFTDVAIGSTGNIYFTGYSTSTSFPLTTGTNITGNAGNEDAIVLKLDNNNVPVWGTFLGGSMDEYAFGITLGQTTNYGYVGFCGTTSSSDFPCLNALTGYSTLHGIKDMFIAKLKETDGT